MVIPIIVFGGIQPVQHANIERFMESPDGSPPEKKPLQSDMRKVKESR
jgi:hypothetical protein